MHRLIVINGRTTKTPRVITVIYEDDMLTTWSEDDGGITIVDETINPSMLEAFEDDLRMIAEAGGFGSIDIIDLEGNYYRYTMSKVGVCKYPCEIVPLMIS